MLKIFSHFHRQIISVKLQSSMNKLAKVDTTKKAYRIDHSKQFIFGSFTGRNFVVGVWGHVCTAVVIRVIVQLNEEFAVLITGIQILEIPFFKLLQLSYKFCEFSRNRNLTLYMHISTLKNYINAWKLLILGKNL